MFLCTFLSYNWKIFYIYYLYLECRKHLEVWPLMISKGGRKPVVKDNASLVKVTLSCWNQGPQGCSGLNKIEIISF